MACGATYCAPESNSLASFNKANDLYQKENYSQAIQQYESILNSGQSNPELYYNLGNSYFRMHQPGRALLNYERGLMLSPRDADIKINIAFVRTALNLQEEGLSEQFLEWLNNLMTLNELAAFCSSLWILLCAGVIVYLFLKLRRIYWLNLSLLAAVIVFGGLLALKIDRQVKTQWAVVIAGPVEARNGPGFDNTVGFTLPEGKKVSVLGLKDEWAAVGLRSEGLKGWVEKKYLEQI